MSFFPCLPLLLLALCYFMTLSARASTFGGVVRPICLAHDVLFMLFIRDRQRAKTRNYQEHEQCHDQVTSQSDNSREFAEDFKSQEIQQRVEPSEG